MDKILSSRLAEKERQHQEEIENVRRQARLQVGAARGNPDNAADLLVLERGKQQAADDVERARLSRYFGPTSSAQEAAALMAESPEAYRKLKRDAERLGLLGGNHRPPAGRSLGFRQV